MEPMPQKPPLCDLRPAGLHQSRPPRQRTFLNGKLVYGEGVLAPDGALTLDCTIRDISEGGVKIVLSKCQPLPAELYLIVIKYCVAYRAKVAWLDYPARGLEFRGTHPLDAALPGELAFLRRLWGDLSARSGLGPSF